MKYTNIVHISDLHLHKDDSVERFNQDLIIDALTNDLTNLRDGPLQPDCIVFSGDLVQSADDGQFDDAATIISLLASAAGLTDDQVFIVPGNHDASRNVIGPSIPKLKGFRDGIVSVDRLNSLARDSSFISYAGNVFSQYENVTASFGDRYKTDANLFVRQYYVRDLNLTLICLNTASLTGAGITEDVADGGQLAFPERSLVEAIKKVPAGAQTVVIGHHPLSFLKEVSRNYIKPILMKDVDLYLFGHMHLAEPEQITAPQGRCMFGQSGSLYASRNWWNGYSIVSMIPGQPHFKITYRKWQEQRREFGVASELNDEGVVFSSSDAKIFWSAIPPRISAKAAETWRKDTFLPYLTDMLCDEGPEQAKDVFVSPEFERDRYIETDSGLEKTTKPEHLSFESIVSLPDNIVIAAGSESGKTTLIRKWALLLASKEYSSIDWSVPVVIRFHEIKKYLSQFEATIKSRLPELPNGLSARSLIENGQVTIFVDDADLRIGDKRSALIEFISKYPKVRYVLLTGTPYLQGAGIAPIIAPDVPFTHVRLKRLKQSQILELIESRGTKDPTRADQLLQRMTQEAASLNVPITPVTGTFLIQIYTEDNGKPLVNRANLIERYVEIVLEKFAPADLLPSTFDYRNKSDVLSFVAAHMCEVGAGSLVDVDLIALIAGYLKRFGLRFSAVNIVEYFVRARIFSREGEMVSFRLSAFLSYFAAMRMIEDAKFRTFILDEVRYLGFRGEISFYAALSRKDSEWLKELFRRFNATSDEVWRDATPDIRDGTLLNTFIPLPPNSKAEDIFALERRIFEAPLTEEERRAVLDEDHDVEEEISQLITRGEKVEAPAAWLGQLTLLSDMLKNMELIETEDKEEVLEAVIKGWLRFACMTMGLIPTIARDRKVSFGGIEYRIVYPDDMEVPEIARRLMAYLPISTAKLAAQNVGTEKLRTQLEAGIGDDPSVTDPSVQFMRGSILAQIGAEGLGSLLTDLRDSLRDYRYLEEVLVRELAEIVVRFRLPDKELAKVRLLAANTIVEIEQPKGTKAAVRRNQVIQSLTSNRLKVQAADRD